MKITEARVEAKRRWGVRAFAVLSRYGGLDHLVGKWVEIGNHTMKEYYGQGKTWEEAFAKATKKGF